MASYRYVAYDDGGRRLTRAVNAQSIEQIKISLWDQNLHIVDIRSRPHLPSAEELFPTFIRVRRSEVILFTRQLATFIRVGMPMLEGLAVLRDQASSGLMRRALDQMLMDLRTGSSLSSAMARYPRIFSELYVDMIRSAEVSGDLDNVLRQLATYMSRDESAVRKIRSAMIYPAIVIGLAVVVVSVLIAFVLPAFARLFSDFRAEMPLPTRILFTVGSFCQEHLLLMLLGLAAVVAAVALYAQSRRGRETFETLLLRIPMLGVIVQYTVIERYLRTMATLARAGVPIAQMLDTAISSVGNVVYRQGLASVREYMLSGDGFAGPLEQTQLFPRLVIQMVKVGEEAGNLDANLEQAADHYGEEVDYRLKRMIAIIEPALVISVGVMVGFIAISVIAPMYALVHAIH
ncbi:MAG TPA: type II secretion system F family protein [Candidatus Dormibacteraeota bacterium]|nr:type II secretion system F family protein [Candidatus Dormibacteraeota bacterium]